MVCVHQARVGFTGNKTKISVGNIYIYICSFHVDPEAVSTGSYSRCDSYPIRPEYPPTSTTTSYRDATIGDSSSRDNIKSREIKVLKKKRQGVKRAGGRRPPVEAGGNRKRRGSARQLSVSRSPRYEADAPAPPPPPHRAALYTAHPLLSSSSSAHPPSPRTFMTPFTYPCRNTWLRAVRVGHDLAPHADIWAT